MASTNNRRQRAYRFVLDPTPAQEAALTAHADAARWAFNFALAQKQLPNPDYDEQIGELIDIEVSWQRRNAYLNDTELDENAAHRKAEQYARETAQRHPATQRANRERVDYLHSLGYTDGGKKDPSSIAAFATKNVDKRIAELEEIGVPTSLARYYASPAREPSIWQMQVNELVTLGYPEAEVRKSKTIVAKGKQPADLSPTYTWHDQESPTWGRLYRPPNSQEVGLMYTAWREDPAADPWRGGICPWGRGINRYAFSSAFRDADQAWSNWLSSLAGTRAGRRVGEPRFKRKGRTTPSFRLHHDAKKPKIRPDGYRRLRLPNIGTVRLHESNKRMVRALDRGGQVQSVTCSRRGHRWYASVLVDEPDLTPGRETQTGPSHRQKAAGRIGVDLGTKTLAALSEPVAGLSDEDGRIANPRHLKKAQRRLVRVQRQMSRRVGPDRRTGQKPSNRWKRARARLSKVHREVAEQRASHLHWITKTLATSYAEVAIEDLNVAGMTRSAKGDVAEPGRNVRAKTGLNRSILDAAPGEFRRQLDYKTPWYGSTVAVCDRWAPTSKTCSACGAVKTKLALSERVYTCNHCGFVCDRDVNAARNIAAMAVPVVPGGGRR